MPVSVNLRPISPERTPRPSRFGPCYYRTSSKRASTPIFVHVHGISPVFILLVPSEIRQRVPSDAQPRSQVLRFPVLSRGLRARAGCARTRPVPSPDSWPQGSAARQSGTSSGATSARGAARQGRGVGGVSGPAGTAAVAEAEGAAADVVVRLTPGPVRGPQRGLLLGLPLGAPRPRPGRGAAGTVSVARPPAPARRGAGGGGGTRGGGTPFAGGGGDGSSGVEGGRRRGRRRSQGPGRRRRRRGVGGGGGRWRRMTRPRGPWAGDARPGAPGGASAVPISGSIAVDRVAPKV